MRLGKKVRTQGRTVGQSTSYGNSQFVEDEQEVDPIVIEPIIGSWNTLINPKHLPETDFQDIFGVYIRNGKAISIPGPVVQTPTKPNSNKILGLFNINRVGVITGLRFTKTTVHKLVSNVFTAITGPALVGGDYDRFGVVYVEDRLFFNNNGLNVLYEIDLTANTYAAAGNARRYKYYVVCNNRIIGANLLAGTDNPTEVAGCGDRNYTEWDPAVDISAFRGSLIDTEGTSIDEITGLASSKDNKLVVFRSNSIWIGYPQPVASTPFDFKKISHVGCNSPFSIQKTDNGVTWYDPFKKNIFFLDFATEEVKSVGDKIRETIISSIGDPARVFSAYDEHNDEYELGYEFVAGDTARIFSLNRVTQSWAFSQVAKGSCLTNAISLQPSVTIDGLGSTPIDSLVGTIDSLSEDRLIVLKLFGTNDGERLAMTNLFSGCSILLKTKAFSLTGYKQFVDRIEIIITKTGSITFLLSGIIREGNFSYTIKSMILTGGTNNVLTIPINRACSDMALTLQAFGGYTEIQSIKIYRKQAGRL